jgi:hypothetical protein
MIPARTVYTNSDIRTHCGDRKRSPTTLQASYPPSQPSLSVDASYSPQALIQARSCTKGLHEVRHSHPLRRSQAIADNSSGLVFAVPAICLRRRLLLPSATHSGAATAPPSPFFRPCIRRPNHLPPPTPPTPLSHSFRRRDCTPQPLLQALYPPSQPSASADASYSPPSLIQAPRLHPPTPSPGPVFAVPAICLRRRQGVAGQISDQREGGWSDI